MLSSFTGLAHCSTRFANWAGPAHPKVVEQIAADLNISDDVQNELTPSGQPRFRNQVSRARFYLFSDN